MSTENDYRPHDSSPAVANPTTSMTMVLDRREVEELRAKLIELGEHLPRKRNIKDDLALVDMILRSDKWRYDESSVLRAEVAQLADVRDTCAWAASRIPEGLYHVRGRLEDAAVNRGPGLAAALTKERVDHSTTRKACREVAGSLQAVALWLSEHENQFPNRGAGEREQAIDEAITALRHAGGAE